MSVQIKNLDKVLKNIEKAGEKGQKAARTGVENFADYILRQSNKIVPFDKGTLAKSIINKKINLQGEKVIGYNQPYAAKQHEDTRLRHPGPKSSNPGRGSRGQAKYLEQPLKENYRKVVNFVGDELKKVLK